MSESSSEIMVDYVKSVLHGALTSESLSRNIYTQAEEIAPMVDEIKTGVENLTSWATETLERGESIRDLHNRAWVLRSRLRWTIGGSRYTPEQCKCVWAAVADMENLIQLSALPGERVSFARAW